MKLKSLFIILVILGGITSCIKDEPLYREADIVSFSLPDDVMVNMVIRHDTVTVTVFDTTGINNRVFAPLVTVSPGASILPASGETIQFQDYKAYYKVVSEYGEEYTKEFTVLVVPYEDLKFDFEEWTNKRYGVSKNYPVMKDEYWCNANLGVAIVVPVDHVYPTRPTTDSYSGNYAALLETQKGGTFMDGFTHIPLFSGSLYRGVFDLNIGKPAESAKFGHIHPEYAGKPVRFTGYYKYTPGEIFTDKDEKPVPGKIDEFSVYSIIYKVTKGAAGRDFYLDGTNIQDSELVIGEARVMDTTPKSEYTHFNVEFIYTEEFDYQNYDYKLAIVLASSKDGNLFEGAIGSTLIVDDIEVICEKN